MGDWPAAPDNEMLKGEGGKTDLAGDGAGSVVWLFGVVWKLRGKHGLRSFEAEEEQEARRGTVYGIAEHTHK
jgi:hypothetical protein